MTDLLRSTLAYKQEHPTPPLPEEFCAINMSHYLIENRSDHTSSVLGSYDLADGSRTPESGIHRIPPDINVSDIKLRDLSVSKEEDHVGEDELYQKG